MVINVAALVATGSLSSLSAFILGLAVTLIAARATIRFALGSAFLTVISFPGMALLGFNPLFIQHSISSRVQTVTGQSSGLGTKVEEGSLHVREQTWAGAWERIQHDPIVGQGLDGMHAAVYGDTVTHNYILHFWYQGGILMLAACLIATWSLLAQVARATALAHHAAASGIIVITLGFALTSAFFDEQ